MVTNCTVEGCGESEDVHPPRDLSPDLASALSSPSTVSLLLTRGMKVWSMLADDKMPNNFNVASGHPGYRWRSGQVTLVSHPAKEVLLAITN